MTDDLTRNDGEAVVNSGEANLSGEAGSSVLVGQAVAPIEIAAPGAGETVNVTLTKGQSANLNFDATSATPVVEGNDFVLTFDSNGDGSADSRIVFQNLVEESQGGDAPILVIGGVELSAGLLIGQAQALVDGETLETAAGAGAGPTGGGGSTYSENLGEIIDLLNAQDGLAGTALEFGLLADGEDIDPGAFTLIVDFETEIAGTEIDGQLFDGGFEDWDHRQDDCEDDNSPMEIKVSFTGGDLLALSISDIPEGALFFIGNPVGPDGQYDKADAETLVGGSILLTPEQLAEGIYLLPPENSDVDIALTFTASAVTDEGEAVTEVVQATAIIDAVVDAAELNINGDHTNLGDFVTTWMNEENDGSGNPVEVRGNRGGPRGDRVDELDVDGSREADPSVAELANGGYVVLWQNEYYDVNAQVFGADGEPRGDAIEVNGWGWAPDVDALDDGGFVAVWTGEGGLQFKMFEYGETPGDVQTIEMPDDLRISNIGDPSVTTLADGGFVVAWSMRTFTQSDDPSTKSEGESTRDLYTQRFNAEGEAVTLVTQIETPKGDYDPDVSALADGGYVIAWEVVSISDDSGASEIQIQRYDVDNNLVFDDKVKGPDADDGAWNAEVAGLSNGGFVVTFSTYSDDNDDGLFVRVFDNTNTEVNAISLDVPGNNDDFNAHVSSLSDGGFVVTWSVERNGNDNDNDKSIAARDGGNGSGVYSQRFDSSGNPVDPVPVLIHGSRGDTDDSHVDGLDCEQNDAIKVFSEDNEHPKGHEFHDVRGGDSNYDLSFDAAIGGDRDGSEELTVIKIGLNDQLLGETEPNGPSGEGAEAGDLGPDGDPRTFTLVSAPEPSSDPTFAPTEHNPDPAQGDAYLVVGGEQVSDGELIDVWAIWAQLDDAGNPVLVDGEPVLYSGYVQAEASIDTVNGTLDLNFDIDINSGLRVWEVFLDGSHPDGYNLPKVEGEGDSSRSIKHEGYDIDAPSVVLDENGEIETVEGRPVPETNFDGSLLEIQLPDHADDDFDVNYSVTTRDNPTDGEIVELDNNETTVTGTLQVEIQAIADGTDLSTDTTYQNVDNSPNTTDNVGLVSVGTNDDGDIQLTYAEDAKSSPDEHGAYTNEEHLNVAVRVDAALIDTDGSESITHIFVNKYEGVATDAVFIGPDGEVTQTIGDPGTIVLTSIPNGVYVTAEYYVDGDGNLHIDLPEYLDDGETPNPALLGQSFNLDGEFSVQLPIDDSSDFKIDVTYTTAEVNTEGEYVEHRKDDHYEENNTITIDVDIEGVVGAARTGFFEDLGYQFHDFTASERGTVEEVEQNTAEDPQGVDRDNFFYDEEARAGVVDLQGALLQSDAGHPTHQDGFVVEFYQGELINIDVTGDGNSVGNIVELYHLVDGDLELVATSAGGDNEDGVLDYDVQSEGQYVVKIYNEGALSGGEHHNYNAEVSVGLSTEYSEDGRYWTSGHGDDASEHHEYVAVNSWAITEDDYNLQTIIDNFHTSGGYPVPYTAPEDLSEAIQSVKISKGESDGTFFSKGGEITVDSVVTVMALYVNTNGDVVFGKITAVASFDGDDLVLTFDEPLVQAVTLTPYASHDAGIAVRLDIDDSTDFTLKTTTTTVEYDDDNVQEYLNGTITEAELLAAGVGNTTSTDDSIEVVVEGVAGAAETDFGYDDENFGFSAESLIVLNEGGENGEFGSGTNTGNQAAEEIGRDMLYLDNGEACIEINGTLADNNGNQADYVDTFTFELLDGEVFSVDLSANVGTVEYVLIGPDGPVAANSSSVSNPLTFDVDGSGTYSLSVKSPGSDADYGLKIGVTPNPDFTVGQDGTVTYSEDNEPLVDDHGTDNPSETSLVIDVKFSAGTEDGAGQHDDGGDPDTTGHDVDDDQSEGIAKIVLDKGVSHGDWAISGVDIPVAEKDVDVSPVAATIGGYAATVYEDTNGDLVIEFVNPVLVQFVDLDGSVSIELPIDDSTDFNLEATTTTYEYDDDQLDDTTSTGLKAGVGRDDYVSEATTDEDVDIVIEGIAGAAESGFHFDNVDYSEDGQSAEVKHGAEVSETGLSISVEYKASTEDGTGQHGDDNTVVDADKSEGIAKIALSKGDSDGAWAIPNVDIPVQILVQPGSSTPFEPADAMIGGYAAKVFVTVSGILVIEFVNPVLVQSVDLDGSVSVNLPIDDSTDFTLTAVTTTYEYDDDQLDPSNTTTGLKPGLDRDARVDQATTQEQSVDINIAGVAGAAGIELDPFNEKDDAGYCGLFNQGFSFDGDGPQTITENQGSYGEFKSDDPEVLGRDMFFFNEGGNQGELTIKGAVAKNPTGAPGSRDSFKVDLEEGETLTVNLSDAGSHQHLMAKIIGETGFDYDEATNTLTFTAPAPGGTYEWTIYNPVQRSGYTAEVSIAASGDPTFVFYEDGTGNPDNQDGSTLSIAANFILNTEDGKVQDTNLPTPSTDDQNSEGITLVTLTLDGAADGTAFVVGSTVTITEGGVAHEYSVTVTDNVLELKLTSATHGAQVIELGDHVSVTPPEHSDDDFSMTVVVTTTEYDDDDDVTGTPSTATASQTMNIIIDAVADPAVIADDDATQGSPSEETTVTIPVDVSFADNDGSEEHTVTVSGIPSDWVPPVGLGFDYEFDTVVPAGSEPGDAGLNTYYTITFANAGSSVDLDLVFNTQDWSSTRWSDGTAHEDGAAEVSVNGIVEEVGIDPTSGEEPKDDNNDATTTVTHTVDIAEDAPELTVANPGIAIDESAAADDNTPAENRAADPANAGIVNAAHSQIHGGIDFLSLSTPDHDPINSALTIRPDAINMGSDGKNDTYGVDAPNHNQENIQFATDVAGTSYFGEPSGVSTTDGTPIFLYSYPGHENVVFGLYNVTTDAGVVTGGSVAYAVTISSPLDDGDNPLQIYVEQYVSLHHPEAGNVADGDHDEGLATPLTALNYLVTDDEGDVSPLGNLYLNFEDDGLLAVDNEAEIYANQRQITGNVIDDDSGEGVDFIGVDGGSVTHVNGEPVDPADGAKTAVAGDKGTLYISSDGSYRYVADDPDPQSFDLSTVEGRDGVDLYAYGEGEAIDFGALASSGVITAGSGGVGIEGGNHDSEVNHNQTNGLSEQLVINFGKEAISAEVVFAAFYQDENGGAEQGKWTAYNAAGVEVATGIFNANEFNDYNNGTGTAEIDTDGNAFQFLVLEALPYNNGGSSGNDSSDFAVKSVSYDTGVEEFDYTITDGDGDTSSATLSVDVHKALDAVEDIVLTNITDGDIEIPEWALLSNDKFGDQDAKDVADVDNAEGGEVSQSGGNVVFELDGFGDHTHTVNEKSGDSWSNQRNDYFGNAEDLTDRSEWGPGGGNAVKDSSLASIKFKGRINNKDSGSRARDYDLVAVSLIKGEVLIVDIDKGYGGNSNNSTNTVLKILDTDRGYFDAHQTNSSSPTSNGGTGSSNARDAYLEFEAPADGIYYVEVTSVNNRDDGNYDLWLSVDDSNVVHNFDYTADDTHSDDTASVSVIVQDGDTITGGDADEILIGGDDDDILLAGGGDDVLIGGTGSDILTGGSGSDTFDFTGQIVGTDVDTIHDFSTSEDVLNIGDLINDLGNDFIATNLQAIDDGSDVHLQVSSDNGATYTDIAILNGVSVGDTLNAMLNGVEEDIAVTSVVI